MVLAAVFLVTMSVVPEPVATAATAVEPAPWDAKTLQRGDAYGHLMSARLALFDDRVQDAIKEIGEAVASLPEDGDLAGEGAGLMLMAGRRGEAETMAKRALGLAPTQRTATRVLGDLAAQRALQSPGEPSHRNEAIRLYEQLLPDDPQAGEILVFLVRLKTMGGDVDGAIASARRFAALRAGDRNGIRLLTEALLAGGRRVEAVDALVDWLHRTPEDDGAVPMLYGLAHELEPPEMDHWEKIAGVMDVVVAAQPEEVMPRLLRGEALLRTGKPRESIPDLEAARDGGRGGPAIRAQLCSAYMAANRLADATDEARALVRDFPDNAAVRSLYADALARQGSATEAVEQYELALRSLPGRDAEGVERRDDLRRRIADQHLARGKPADAAKILGALENVDDLDSLETRARIAVRTGNYADARKLAGKLRAREETGAAIMIEGEALVREGKLEQAKTKFGEATTMLGDRARVPAAAVYRETGHLVEGEALLRAWATAKPQEAQARFELGSFLERTNRFAEAETELRESIRLDGEFDEALNYLGYALIDRNEKVDEGLGMIRRALELEPDNGAYLDSLGWGLFRLGRYDEARSPLERAVREFPNDPTVLEHLGDLYGKLGESARAGDVWRRALAAGPDKPEELERKLSTPPLPTAPR